MSSRTRCRADYGVTAGHWPQSMALSTVGGWLACRGAGQYSTRYGKIEDMVVGLEVVLADGCDRPHRRRRPAAAVGPDLNQFFVGSEGTLGVITEATLRVHPVPPATSAARTSSPPSPTASTCAAASSDAAPRPRCCASTTSASRAQFNQDGNVLLVLDEGDAAIVASTMIVVNEECSSTGVAIDDGLLDQWLAHRNDTSGLQEAYRKDIVVDTTEIAARWSALPAIYEQGVVALKSIDGMWVASAHQSHSYTDGACVYFTWAGQPPDGNKDRFYAAAWDAIMQAVVDNEGAVSHHHGIGLNRGKWVGGHRVLDPIKAALDPNGILNPGKLGLPSPFAAPQWP